MIEAVRLTLVKAVRLITDDEAQRVLVEMHDTLAIYNSTIVSVRPSAA